MTRDEDCHICGKCWWNGCENDADFALEVDLKRGGLPLYLGKVDLCGGHTQQASANGGRLNLNWRAIEQALARDRIVI
jgi:hypothetical protein